MSDLEKLEGLSQDQRVLLMPLVRTTKVSGQVSLP
jgi:hypothetical protein